MRPRAVCGAVRSMARPRRPLIEREAVLVAAADMRGSGARKAYRIARAVAERALCDLDGDAADQVLLRIDALRASPIATLATDPEVDTAAIIRAERASRMGARGWRRPTDAEWAQDDRSVLAATVRRLAKRYARHLAKSCP